MGAAIIFTLAESLREEAGDSRGAVNRDPTMKVEKTGGNPRSCLGYGSEREEGRKALPWGARW